MRDRLFITLFLLPGLFMILVMLYYPAVDGIVMSFQDVKSYNISVRSLSDWIITVICLTI